MRHISKYHISFQKFRTELNDSNPLSILDKFTAGRYGPVRVADGPITVRCGFIKNASWEKERKLLSTLERSTGKRLHQL